MIVFIFIYQFGYEVWIFPYFLCDGVPFLESFKVPIGYCKIDESRWNVVLKLTISALFILGCVYLYKNPEIYDLVKEWVSYIYNQILEWGNNKITDHHVNLINVE